MWILYEYDVILENLFVKYLFFLIIWIIFIKLRISGFGFLRLV